MPGISKEGITVNLERDAFTVSYDASQASLEDMYQAIAELGYTPGLQAPEKTGHSIESEGEPSPIDTALTVAARDGKLVLVDFFAEWCAACKVLEAQIFSDTSVMESLESYVLVTIDTDTYPDVARDYEVVGMPTLIILDATGNELFRNVGLITPKEFSLRLDELVAE